MYMGLDLSLSSAGICVINKDLDLVYVDRVTPPKMTKEENSNKELKDIIRISNICKVIGELIVNYDISFCVIEGQYYSSNAKTIKQLSKLIGAVEYELYKRNVKFIVKLPSEIRLDISGFGDLTKEENYLLVLENLGHLDIVKNLGEFNDNNNKAKNSDKYDAITIIASELVKEGMTWKVSETLKAQILNRKEQEKKERERKKKEKKEKKEMEKKKKNIQ